MENFKTFFSVLVFLSTLDCFFSLYFRQEKEADESCFPEDECKNLIQGTEQIFKDGFFMMDYFNSSECLNFTYYVRKIEKQLYHDSQGQTSAIKSYFGSCTGIYKNNRTCWHTKSQNWKQLEEMASKQIDRRISIDRDIHFKNGKNTRAVRSVPEELVVETLIFLTENYVDNFKSRGDIMDYFAVMFQYVNLQFKTLTNPKIRFLIVGIVVDSNGYFEEHVKKFKPAENSTFIDVSKFADSIPSYLEDLKLNIGYDIGAVFTDLDLGYTDQDGNFRSGVLGIANWGGACHVKKYTIIEDLKTFHNAPAVTVHEFGHLLRAHHDQSTENCKNDKSTMECCGFTFPLKWSNCTKDDFKEFSVSDQASCLIETSKIMPQC